MNNPHEPTTNIEIINLALAYLNRSDWYSTAWIAWKIGVPTRAARKLLYKLEKDQKVCSWKQLDNKLYWILQNA